MSQLRGRSRFAEVKGKDLREPHRLVLSFACCRVHDSRLGYSDVANFG
jgi:hypothetical protein